MAAMQPAGSGHWLPRQARLVEEEDDEYVLDHAVPGQGAGDHRRSGSG